MFPEGLAPLFSHANNLIRLILSHRPMPVVNRGATNAQIARLPTHTLPRTTTTTTTTTSSSSSKGKGKGKGKKRKAPGDEPVPANAKSEGGGAEAVAAAGAAAGSGGGAAAADSADDQNLKMPAGSSAAAEEETELGACTICMEDYKGGEKLCTLPCSHVYHFKVWKNANGWGVDGTGKKIRLLSPQEGIS
jgi:hypothetical protein